MGERRDQREHGRQKVPVGIGSRLQEVHAGLLDYSGTFTGWFDEATVAGSSNILVAFQMFQQGELTQLYVRITNKVSGKTITLKKVTGDPSFTLGSPEEFAMWSWDFDFEDIAYT